MVWWSPPRSSNQVLLYGSNRNPLDVVERDFVAGAIVELGSALTFVQTDLDLQENLMSDVSFSRHCPSSLASYDVE